MKYNKTVEATFVERPNRFVAKVLLDGKEIYCHVKNTGRCRELLVPGATVWLEDSENPNRKYRYSLVTVKKGDRLVNMDSQAPNKAVGEWLKNGGLFGNIKFIKPESTYGTSRFDFYCEYEDKKAYIEVKGVTLENDNAKTDKELVILRDSFGGSLAPLFTEAYKKITVIDIRYIQSSFIGNLEKFDNKDVLFIYSTALLNNSLAMK